MPSTIAITKGDATANAYATVQEADSYLDDLYGADEWGQLDDDSKARLILTAAKMIDAFDAEYASLADTQGMWFPVTGYKTDGFNEAKEANILQAFHLFQNSDAMTESRTGAMQGTTSESLGPTSRSSVGFNQFRKYAPAVLRLLAPFIKVNFSVRRG
jgi:hypothetical protein